MGNFLQFFTKLFFFTSAFMCNICVQKISVHPNGQCSLPKNCFLLYIYRTIPSFGTITTDADWSREVEGIQVEVHLVEAAFRDLVVGVLELIIHFRIRYMVVALYTC